MSKTEFTKLTHKGTFEIFFGRNNEKYLQHKNAYIDKVLPVDIPTDNFFISTTAEGSWLTYKTDGYRTIDLQPFVETTIFNTNEILRDGNSFYVIGNFLEDENSNALLLRLNNCKISNNQFTFESIEEVLLPKGRVHGSSLHRGSLYMVSRPMSHSGYTNIMRITESDFTQVDLMPLTGSTQFQGIPTDIIGYNGDAYTIVTSAATSVGRVVKINGDMSGFSLAFSCGNVSSTKRIKTQSPFIIYEDEIFIPTVNNSSQPLAGNSIGMSVYSLTGTIKREVAGLIISSGQTAQPFPHWMGLHEGKIILTNTGGIHRFMARFDATTLALEEVADSGCQYITDDNTIFSDGYVYLNGEVIDAKLIKVKYNDFTDFTVEISNYNNGMGSYGSLNQVLNT